MNDEVIEYAKCFIGSRYQWTGEGPYNVGFDCSGLMLEVLRAFGNWGKDDATAQNIYDRFSKTFAVEGAQAIRARSLIFFGKDRAHITHIAMGVSTLQFIEAGGGDSKTVDKGMVRLRPNWVRSDIVAVIDIEWKLK